MNDKEILDDIQYVACFFVFFFFLFYSFLAL